jgi:predicted nuclease with TOPRIM domain
LSLYFVGSKQSLDALEELRYAGFDLKELKQLKNTVSEIAAVNNIEYYDAGMRLLKDIEKQYDNKLGFEPKIKELETKLKKLEAEDTQYKEYLHSMDIVSKALSFLYRYGVTDEDIINMTAIVTAYAKGNIIFNPSLQLENMIDKDKVMEKTQYWKSFIQEIKNLGNINSQTANQRSYLEVIKKEIDDLNLQRQKLNEETLKLGQSLNSLSSQLSSFMEFIKQIMFSVNNTSKMLIAYQPLFFINVTIRDDSKYDNNMDENDKSP